MFKKTLPILVVLLVALAILFVSIFNSSAIKYPVNHTLPSKITSETETSKIDYPLPYAGNILPDSPLWKLKALRDKVWFITTTSHLRRAELALLFSDKRLVMTYWLLEKGNTDTAISTFTKGEKYLTIAVNEEKIARDQGVNTDVFLEKLLMATLKHKEFSNSLIQLAPEEARPLLIKTEVYAEDAYKSTRDALYSKGLPELKDPFCWD